MKRLLVSCACVIWLVPVICADASTALVPQKKPPTEMPWDDMSDRARTVAQQMIEKPTTHARGPSETFACTPEQYYWLLENPDRVVTAWRRLGAKCVGITRRAPGRFGYSDEQGSDVSWETIHQGPGIRVWFAEGKVKPGLALPLVPVKALVIMRHTAGKTADGSTVVQHQAEVVIQTDSKAATLVTKMMGQSATKLAEQGLGQLQLFFSALSSYVDRHPDQVDALFRQENGQAIQQVQKINR